MIFVNDIIRIIAGGLGGTDRPQRPDGLLAHSEVSQGNGADTTDDVLYSVKVPKGALNNPGTMLEIFAMGHSAANGNNKTIKAWIGPDVQTLGAAVVTTSTTTIATSGVVTPNNAGWCLQAEVVKTGAYNSDTQIAQGQVAAGATHTGTNKTVALTLDEDIDQYVTITGASGTTGAQNDLVGDCVQVYLTNGG